ncbi:MAG TPA: metalloregulator ArsR/SmtB family transcription factor [Candidatus Limnocylindria bacterium]|jgi:ArsR family transcriptional regulator
MDEIANLQAEVLRALAYPRRLQILHCLADGPVDVGTLAAELDISQPNASQHLAVMRAAGVVEAERVGREVRYRISDPDVIAACDLMRGVLQRRIGRLAGLSGGTRPHTPELAHVR